MHRKLIILIWLFVAAALAAPEDQVRQLVQASGVQGGLIVHVGCSSGPFTAALRVNERFLVHGLAATAADAEAVRQHLQALGLYGGISVEPWSGSQLPYIDNLVNLLIVENPASVPLPEMMRVLAPNGVALLKSGAAWDRKVKPRPAEIDDWTHYLHDAQGTMVSSDSVVGLPRRMQWLSDPKWLRNHDFMSSFSGMVSAGGRIFYLIDEGLREDIYLPGRWAVVARDAFNGTLLWRKPIENWWPHTWPFKSGPADLPRRIVAVNDRVYVTLGLTAPLCVLDAATGALLRTFEETRATEEIVLADDILYLLVNPQKQPMVYQHAVEERNRESTRANTEFGWTPKSPQRVVMAVSAQTGEVLWRHQNSIAPLSLSLDAANVYFFDGSHIVSLTRAKGEVRWISETAGAVLPTTGYAPRLIVGSNVVVLSTSKAANKGEANRLVGVAAENGKVLWRTSQPASGHFSPEDLFLINDRVWSTDTFVPKDNLKDGAAFQAVDLLSGKTSEDFIAKHFPAFFMHQRCYPGRATKRYILTSGTGTEFLDLATKQIELHHWLRGACIYGLMPANGLLYRPPETCACYYQSRVTHFCALAPEASAPRVGVARQRLEVATSNAAANLPAETPNPADWPIYRHDAQRSGCTPAAVPAQISVQWSAHLGGKLTPPTAADGKLFLAAPEQHLVCALSADTGKPAWTFTAGGRVDGPPTLHRGLALFGCADGWVYCLRASDGQLLWRYRVAPADDRLVSYNQIESVWPMSASVMVREGIVYCIAGRNMFLDGGLRLVRLEAATGKVLSETVMDDKDPATGKNLQTLMAKKSIPLANPELLSCDSKFVYMAAQRFDFNGQRLDLAVAESKESDQAGEGRHLFCPTGFLDDSWFHRTYWIYGRNAGEGHFEYPVVRAATPTGRIMVFDDANVYGFYALNINNNLHPATSYVLYSTDKNQTGKADKNGAPKAAKGKGKAKNALAVPEKVNELASLAPRWTLKNPGLLVNAMVLGGKNLFLAGPPAVADGERQAEFVFGQDNEVSRQLERQEAAWHGKAGALLAVVSADRGEKIAQYPLAALPVWDGMIAANGRLYAVLKDGQVVCLGAK